MQAAATAKRTTSQRESRKREAEAAVESTSGSSLYRP